MRIVTALTRLGVGVCLAVAFGVAVLWARSDRRSDYLRVGVADRQTVFMTFPGGVEVMTWPDPTGVAGRGVEVESYVYEERNAFGAWASRPDKSWRRLGFDVRPVRFSNRPTPEPRAIEADVPFWFVLLACAPLPTAVLLRERRRRRLAAEGRCAACGYDLRGSGDRCPECGADAGRLRIPAASEKG